MTAEKLAQILRDAGIMVLDCNEEDASVDAGVKLSDNLDVQITSRSGNPVYDGLFILNRWDEAGEYSEELGVFSSVKSLIEKLLESPDRPEESHFRVDR